MREDDARISPLAGLMGAQMRTEDTFFLEVTEESRTRSY